MRKLLLSLATVLMMSACETSDYIVNSYKEQDSEARKLEAVSTSIIRPVVGDVQVGSEKLKTNGSFLLSSMQI